ncbi:MAG: FliM/FliN family flagellar motor switch protein [Pseudomonadota bacterium]
MTTRSVDQASPPKPRAVSAIERADAKPLKSDNLRRPDPDAGRLPKSVRNVLTSDEIEALLNPDFDTLPVAPAEVAHPGHASADPETSSSLYDQEKHARALALTEACDGLIARLSHRFQSDGGIGAVLRLGQVETRPFRASVEAHTGTAIYVCFANDTDQVGAVLILSAEAAATAIECASGADDPLSLAARPRPLTELDEALLVSGLVPINDLFPAFRVTRAYAHRSKAAATVPPGDGIRLSLTLQIGARAWPTVLLLDTAALGKGPAMKPSTRDDPEPSQAPPNNEAVHNQGRGALTTVLTARVASLTVPLSTIGNLKPGATLDLGLQADSPVSLVTGGDGGQTVAQGALGREGDRIAVRLHRKSRAFS